MDWIMCLLPFAVCFVGFLATAKVTKKKKRFLTVAGVGLFLVAAFSSLVIYRYQNIRKPIRGSERLAVAELTVSPLQDRAEMNNFQTSSSTEIYQELSDYLERAIYLPCINQDTFSVGSRDVILQYGTDDTVALWLAFYEDTQTCLVNGKKVYLFPRGSSGKRAYQEIEAILESASVHTVVTVASIDAENDCLMVEEENGKRYALHKISEKLRTAEEKALDIRALAVGDTLTVLSDGAILLSDPYQFENIYKIYYMEE